MYRSPYSALPSPIIQHSTSTMPRGRNIRTQPAQGQPASQPQPAANVSPRACPAIKRATCLTASTGKMGVTGAARFALYGVVLGNLSNAFSDNGPELPGGKAVSPWSHSPASVIPTTGSSDTFSRSASQVLLAPPPVKAPRKYADDILHFFDRGSRAQGTGTICKS